MKQTLDLSGKLLLPLKEGERAMIQSGGKTILTSAVVNIIEDTTDMAHFETMNSVYKVSLIAVPHKAALLKSLLMCA